VKRGQAGRIGCTPYVTSGSFEAAMQAAGATIECARAVLDGATPSAFAIVRPPGHHAEPDCPMGFCLFNNLAIAVADVLARGTPRVMIVDFDAHHGNGTQAAFLHEPRVAYLSTHQRGIYPGSGYEHEAPEARGRVVNVPLPAYAGDECYARVMQELALPLARAFQPQAVFVSAGYDAHWRDPITSLGLSTTGFHGMVSALVHLARETAHDTWCLCWRAGTTALAGNIMPPGALCSRPPQADGQGHRLYLSPISPSG
jgi:acetoin utilization deacetylase AcuC-like enzyme